MRIFWYQGGLHLQPESIEECQALDLLSKNVKFERPPEMLCSTPSGESEAGESGCQKILDFVSGRKQIGPRRLAR